VFADPAARHRPRAVCDTVTVTTVLAGTDMYIATVVASADGDTTATIPHGLGAIPLEFYATQLLSQALTALSAWSWAIDTTNLVGTKLASTGSGNAAAQVRVVVKRPHSIGK